MRRTRSVSRMTMTWRGRASSRTTAQTTASQGTPPPVTPRLLRDRGLFAGCSLDGTCDLHARRDTELAEHVPDVGLDGLLAEEQRGGDLRVGLAVGDELRHLELAFGQGFEPARVDLARARAPMDVPAQLAQL